MNVLFVVTGLAIGGAEKQVCSLADAFVSKGFRVKIVTLTADKGVLPDSIGIEVISLNIKKGSLFSFFKAMGAYRGIFKSFEPDVIHAHMFHANIFTRLMQFFIERHTLINTAHNKTEGGRLRVLAYRLTDRLCDLFTNVSKEAVQEFENVRATPKNRMIHIYNGVDQRKYSYSAAEKKRIREELGIASDEQLILSVGRLTKQKNHVLLLGAFKELLKIRPFKLVIVGDGPERIKLERVIEELGIGPSVILYGKIDNAGSFYSASDLFVLSSAWEGFGLVLVEAILSECIVVSTDCGGVREVIGDDNLLVPVNDKAALANKINSVLSLSEVESRNLKNNLKHRVLTHFTLSIIADIWESKYLEYIEKCSK